MWSGSLKYWVGYPEGSGLERDAACGERISRESCLCFR